MLSRITGGSQNEWKITSMDECESSSGISADHQAQMQIDVVPERVNAIVGTGRPLKFMFSPGSRTYSGLVVGRARSEQAMDSTAHVQDIIANSCTSDGPDDVIGELQFCYLTGVLLGNISCMEQWGHVLKILFKAFRFAVEEASFFTRILEVFQAQLVYDDEYLQGSIFDHSNHLQEELKVILTVFKSRLGEQLTAKGDYLREDEVELNEAFDRLEARLSKLGWDLGRNYLRVGQIQLEDGEYVDAEMEELEAEDERGEYAPVIVELDEGGRERGTIGW
jgi:A1 cistron-splicing factor AAR2